MMGTMELVGVIFDNRLFVHLALAGICASIGRIVEAFDALAVVCELAVLCLIRGLLTGSLVGFAKFEAGTNNPHVTLGPDSVFPC